MSPARPPEGACTAARSAEVAWCTRRLSRVSTGLESAFNLLLQCGGDWWHTVNHLKVFDPDHTPAMQA